MDPSRGHCNGTRYIVCQVGLRCITAAISCGEYSGNILFIPRIPLSPTDAGLPFTLHSSLSDQRLHDDQQGLRSDTVAFWSFAGRTRVYRRTAACRIVGIPATSDFCTEWSDCKRHLHNKCCHVDTHPCRMCRTFLPYSVVSELPVVALLDVQT